MLAGPKSTDGYILPASIHSNFAVDANFSGI